MRDWVNEWRQEGLIYIWRYTEPTRSWLGWHFTGDEVGCRSLRNLLDRMPSGEPCHRTLDLGVVTDAILDVPNYGRATKGKFDKLRIEFDPDAPDLVLEPDGAKLTMTVGDARLRFLTAALAHIEIGQGDFGIRTSNDPKSDQWMFWWMPAA